MPLVKEPWFNVVQDGQRVFGWMKCGVEVKVGVEGESEYIDGIRVWCWGGWCSCMDSFGAVVAWCGSGLGGSEDGEEKVGVVCGW